MSTQSFVANDYNTGLFQCTDDYPSLFDGLFCPWCMLSAEMNMMLLRKPGVHLVTTAQMIVMDICFCGFASSSASVAVRSKIRELFQLSESPAAGCLIGCFLRHCSMCQVYRELSIRGFWPEGVCVDKPYKKPGLVAPSVAEMGVSLPSGPSLAPSYHQPQPCGQPQFHGQPQSYGQPQLYGQIPQASVGPSPQNTLQQYPAQTQYSVQQYPGQPNGGAAVRPLYGYGGQPGQ